MSYAVEVRSLVKKFPYRGNVIGSLNPKPKSEVVALNEVSFQIPEGEIFGLIGPNSAGKTTLINILCTSILPTSGSAFVGGLDVTKDAARTRRLIGLVTSNERSFYWRLTGRENLRFFASLYRLTYKDVCGWIEQLIRCLDLESFAGRRFDSYSTGIRQRFALARALLHKPPILFMDEPTKGLDPIAAAGLIELIKGQIIPLWRPTLMLTSHNLREIEQLCRIVAIMHKGRIVCSGLIEQLVRDIVPYKTYRLTVSKMALSTLDSLKKLFGVHDVRVAQFNGTFNVDVDLSHGEGALSSVFQTLLSEGGTVYECIQPSVTLERVLAELIGPSGER